MFKIGFDAKRAFANKSGLGNYSRDVIRNLSVFFPENTYNLFSPHKKTLLLEEKYITQKVTPKGLYNLAKPLWRSYGMTHHFDKLGLDIFHGLSNELPFNIHKSKVKKVVTIHDLIFLRYPDLYKFFDRWLYTKKARYACDIADAIIATSNKTKLDIINLLGVNEKKIYVVYQTCNDIFSKKCTKNISDIIKKKYQLPNTFILNVGTIESRKNALSILKAMQLSKINIPLVLIGRATDYLQELKRYVADNKMDSQLIILENVSNNELGIIYNLSCMFIYPSLYEGFGIPILEAFNAGTPVITTESGSTGEVSADAAVLIDPYNIEALGEAINNFIENKNLRIRYVNAGYERAKLFSSHNVSDSLMQVYKSLS